MVTRSPFSAWVRSMASAAGASRNGAMAATTSNVSPSTKRSAFTLPSRYLAARSPLAGVRRGSSIALSQEFVDCAGRLAFAAFRPRGFCRWRPAIDIDMQPAFGVFDEALQKKRAGDRARERPRWRVGDSGDFGIEPAIIRRPQRHSPQWIVLPFGVSRDVLCQRVIVGVKGR